MLVKRTKNGFSLKLDWPLRYSLHFTLIDFIEDGKKGDVNTLLHNAVLSHLVMRKNFMLEWRHECKMTVTMPEGIALMLYLRHYDDNMQLLQLKSEIHKLLHV